MQSPIQKAIHAKGEKKWSQEDEDKATSSMMKRYSSKLKGIKMTKKILD